MTRQILSRLAVALLVFCTATTTHAVTTTWDDGGTGSDWDTVANWNPDGVPGTNDQITLGAGSSVAKATGNIILDEASLAGTLHIESGASLTLTTGSLKLNADPASAQIDGTLTLKATGAQIVGRNQLTNVMGSYGLTGTIQFDDYENGVASNKNANGSLPMVDFLAIGAEVKMLTMDSGDFTNLDGKVSGNWAFGIDGARVNAAGSLTVSPGGDDEINGKWIARVDTANTSTLTLVGAPLPLPESATVLAGWYDFGTVDSTFKSGIGKTANAVQSGITGTLVGGDGSRGTWSSTDGTFGVLEPTGDEDTAGESSTANGAIAMRTNDANLDITLNNNTGDDVNLDSILFDIGRTSSTGPDALSLVYFSGDLDDPDGTSINSITGLAGSGPTLLDDWIDYDWSLSSLTDMTLADGESATFRFTVNTATNGGMALGIDNIAFTTMIVPEPSSVVLLGLGLIGLFFVRRWTRAGMSRIMI